MTQDKIIIDANLTATGVAQGVKDLESLKGIVDTLNATLGTLKTNYSAFLKSVGNAKTFNSQLKTYAAGGVDSQLSNASLQQRLNLLKSIQDQQTQVYNKQASYIKQEAQLYKSLGLIQANAQGTGTLGTDKSTLQMQRIIAEAELGQQQLRYTNKTTSGVNIAKDIAAAEAKIAEIDAALVSITENEKQIAQAKRDQLTYTEKLDVINRKIGVNQAVAAATPADDLRATKASQLLLIRSQIAKEELILSEITDKTTAEYAAQEKILVEMNLQLQKAQALQTSVNKSAAPKANDGGAAARAASQQRLFGDFGASLFKIQAGLLLNYTVMNQIFNLFSFGSKYVTDLDKAFFDLQATIAATDYEMTGLSNTIIEVAQGTRFSAVEVAEAAKTLGQAGFSATQIQDALQGVVLLATATGETLAKSTDVASSVISVFNLRAEDMGRVANVVTGAINDTKLTMDKLAAGIQYSGNIADTFGISLEETTAILGAMSDAGIQTGSSLGTGLRQVLIELGNPTEKFDKALHSVGLTVGDVDVKAKGFVPVMKTLRDAGFSTADAFDSLGVRGAAAFAAIEKNPEIIDSLTQSFLFSDAAAKANETQMRSLSNIFDQFKNQLGTFIVGLSGGLVDALKEVTKGLTAVLGVLNALGPVLPIIGTIIAGFTFEAILPKILGFVKNMFFVKQAVTEVAVAMGEATTATEALTVAMTFLEANPIASGVMLTAAIAGFALFNEGTDRATENIDKLKGKLNETQGEFDKSNDTITSVNDSITKLTDKFSELSKDPGAVFTEMISLENQFGAIGLTIDNKTNPSVLELIESLKTLRQELQKTSDTQIQTMLTERALLFQKQVSKGKDDTKLNRLANIPLSPSGIISMTTQPILGAKGSVSAANDYFSRQNGIDLSSASPDILRGIEADATDTIQTLNKSLMIIDNKIKDQTAHGGADPALEKQRDELISVIGDVKDSAATVADYITDNFKQMATALDNTSTAQTFQYMLTNFTASANILEANIDAAKTPQGRTEAEKQLNDFIAQTQGTLLSYLSDNIDAITQEMEKQLGHPVDKAKVQSMIDGALKTQITQFQQQAAGINNTKIAETMKKYQAGLSRAQAVFSNMNTVFQHVNDALDSASKNLDAIESEATDLANGGLAGKYGDQELANMKTQQKNLSTAELYNQMQNLPKLIAAQGGIVGQYQAIATERAGANARNPNDPDTQKAMAASQTDVINAEATRLDLEKQLVDTTNKYNAAVGIQVVQNESFYDQLRDAVNAYTSAIDKQSTWTYDLKANVDGTLDDSRAGFKQFAMDVATGTQSIGNSFKTLIRTILNSMLSRTTDKLAEGLTGVLGAGLSALGGSLFGGSGSTIVGGNAVSNTPVPGGYIQNFARGGYVKANAGSYIGRDNTLVLAQKGEGILNRAAMSVIGENTFAGINAKGNAAVSTSNANVASASQQATQGDSVVNVWVVSPDQKPTMSKNDVIVTIADNISTGGPIKKLIKSVVQGA